MSKRVEVLVKFAVMLPYGQVCASEDDAVQYIEGTLLASQEGVDIQEMHSEIECDNCGNNSYGESAEIDNKDYCETCLEDMTEMNIRVEECESCAGPRPIVHVTFEGDHNAICAVCGSIA